MRVESCEAGVGVECYAVGVAGLPFARCGARVIYVGREGCCVWLGAARPGMYMWEGALSLRGALAGCSVAGGR